MKYTVTSFRCARSCLLMNFCDLDEVNTMMSPAYATSVVFGYVGKSWIYNKKYRTQYRSLVNRRRQHSFRRPFFAIMDVGFSAVWVGWLSSSQFFYDYSVVLWAYSWMRCALIFLNYGRAQSFPFFTAVESIILSLFGWSILLRGSASFCNIFRKVVLDFIGS